MSFFEKQSRARMEVGLLGKRRLLKATELSLWTRQRIAACTYSSGMRPSSRTSWSPPGTWWKTCPRSRPIGACTPHRRCMSPESPAGTVGLGRRSHYPNLHRRAVSRCNPNLICTEWQWKSVQIKGMGSYISVRQAWLDWSMMMMPPPPSKLHSQFNSDVTINRKKIHDHSIGFLLQRFQVSDRLFICQFLDTYINWWAALCRWKDDQLNHDAPFVGPAEKLSPSPTSFQSYLSCTRLQCRSTPWPH